MSGEGGHLWQEDMHDKGRGHVKQGGTCMQERQPLKRGYASYWNAFLLNGAKTLTLTVYVNKALSRILGIIPPKESMHKLREQLF